jgi:hypothetical protein
MGTAIITTMNITTTTMGITDRPAMAAGPEAASSVWASLMANNDPVPALADCRKSVSIASDGRHYWCLPIWLDGDIVPY